jgi:hypothetical protein
MRIGFIGNLANIPKAVLDSIAKAQSTADGAATAAAEADDTAKNARQMVLNRDPRLTSLDAAVAAGDATHATINERIDQIQLKPGPANTLSIGSVTTAQPGTQATATVTGTAPSQTLNLTIPQGAAGTPGAGIQRIATGIAKLPALLALGSTDVTITLTRAMPTTTYTVDLMPSSALLGAATYTVQARTTTTVTVRVAASLALSLGSTISVMAYA